MIMIFIKTNITYFWLKSKIYPKKVSVIANNTHIICIIYTFIIKHSFKKTCE